MSSLLTLIGWCILFIVCWPLAIVVLLLAPIIWLVSLPLKLIGISLDAVFALIKAILLLPARMLGYRPT